MTKAPDDKMVSMKLVRAVLAKQMCALSAEVRHAEKQHLEALRERRKTREAMIAARTRVEMLTQMEEAEKREAIEHNAAEYVCDPETGATEFRWRESDHAR